MSTSFRLKLRGVNAERGRGGEINKVFLSLFPLSAFYS
jgi:hypothetical protein